MAYRNGSDINISITGPQMSSMKNGCLPNS